jgi:acyl carrier protein
VTSPAGLDGDALDADSAIGVVDPGRVADMVRTRVGVEVTDPDADLLSTGIIDSLSFVTLLLAIEQEFGILVDVERMDLDDVRSVARIAAFVDRELRARASSQPDARSA